MVQQYYEAVEKAQKAYNDALDKALEDLREFCLDGIVKLINSGYKGEIYFGTVQEDNYEITYKLRDGKFYEGTTAD